MTDPRAHATLDELVLHNTRLTRQNRLALELVAKSGRTLQQLTNDAVGEYLAAHYPEALAAVGDPEREREQIMRYLDQRPRLTGA